MKEKYQVEPALVGLKVADESNQSFGMGNVEVLAKNLVGGLNKNENLDKVQDSKVHPFSSLVSLHS